MLTHTHLRINMFFLLVVGLVPIGLKGRFKFFNYVHKIFFYVVVVCFALFVATLLIEVCNILDGEMFDIVTNLAVSFLYCGAMVKVFVGCSNPIAKLMKQIHEKEQLILGSDDEAIKNIYMDAVRLNYWANKLFIGVTVVTQSPYYFTPIMLEWRDPPGALYDVIENITIYRPRPLPYVAWFPFDKYKYYYVSYGWHIWTGTCGAMLTLATDILFYGLIIYAIGQIKILQHYLENFKMYAIQFQEHNPGHSLDEATEIVVGRYVTEHKVIIKYIEDLDASMKFLMLLDFALTSMQMAMIGFLIIFVEFGMQQLVAIEFLIAALIQMFLFYWHANEILLESDQISTAIYNSDWFDCHPRTKRSFLLMMMRSDKPLTLSVGPFYVMCTQTALSILRAAYSYVALLRQTYIMKEEA